VLLLLHDIFVHQIIQVRLAALDVCKEKLASFLRLAGLKAFVPLKALKLEVEVENEQRIDEVDVGETTVAKRLLVDKNWLVKKSYDGVGVILALKFYLLSDP
jgi:hypothetical protein